MGNIKAFYTESFHEFNSHNPSWLSETLQLDTTDHTNAFCDMLISMWGVYEIAGETEDEQKLFMLDTFNQHKQYYLELLTNYEKEFSWWLDGYKRTVSHTGTSTVTASGKDTELHIDLPNKVVSSDNYENYPSTVDVTKPGSTTTTTPNLTTTYENTEEFISKKREYMNQIRNIYAEFASRFYDCFLGVFL